MNQIMKIIPNTMDTGAIIGYIQNLDFENRKLSEELNRLKGSILDADRFYAAAISVEMVASLHNVHPDTVRKYVKMGLIEKHPDSTDSKILIRGSVALLLDFTELRKQSRIRNYTKL